MSEKQNGFLKILKDYFIVIVAFATIVGSFYVLQSNSKQHEERIQKLETKVSNTDERIAQNSERLARIEEKLELIYSVLIKNFNKLNK
jgi:uncharacterized coiled-coil protein SlyX